MDRAVLITNEEGHWWRHVHSAVQAAAFLREYLEIKHLNKEAALELLATRWHRLAVNPLPEGMVIWVHEEKHRVVEKASREIIPDDPRTLECTSEQLWGTPHQFASHLCNVWPLRE